MRRIINFSNTDGTASKWRYIVIGLIALVIIGVSIPLVQRFYADQMRSVAINKDKETYRKTEEKMHELRAQNKFPEAITAGSEYIKTAKSGHNKAMVYSMQGAIYEQWGTDEHALDVYIKATEAAGQDMYAATIGVARTANRLGDKKRALIYYKKSLALLEKNGSRVYTPDIAHLKRVISQIESEMNQ